MDIHVHRGTPLLENGRKEIKPSECIYFCISPLFTTHKYPAIKADISRHILYDMYKSSRFNFLWESAATTIKLRTKAGERGAGWSIKKRDYKESNSKRSQTNLFVSEKKAFWQQSFHAIRTGYQTQYPVWLYIYPAYRIPIARYSTVGFLVINLVDLYCEV